MTKTVFTVKRAYGSLLKRINGIEGELDWAVARIDEAIVQLGDARSALINANSGGRLDERVKKVEDRIRQLYEKKKDIIAKRADMVSRAKELEAEKRAAEICSGLGDMSFCSVEQTLADCDAYIKRLEAELSTADFFEGLK